MRRYGITPEEYDQLAEEQAGGCAICGEPCKTRRVLSVDHDHTTGAVRGLLCDSHNKAIGLFCDDPTLLMAAAAYLLQHSA
jgi:Recombination endonuclease VII